MDFWQYLLPSSLQEASFSKVNEWVPSMHALFTNNLIIIIWRILSCFIPSCICFIMDKSFHQLIGTGSFKSCTKSCTMKFLHITITSQLYVDLLRMHFIHRSDFEHRRIALDYYFYWYYLVICVLFSLLITSHFVQLYSILQ